MVELGSGDANEATSELLNLVSTTTRETRLLKIDKLVVAFNKNGYVSKL